MFEEGGINEVPKRQRRSESRFESTEDWRRMKAKIDKGIKPGTGVWTRLTKKEMAAIGITNRRTIARFVQRYVTETGKDYTVKSFHQEGTDVVAVINER